MPFSSILKFLGFKGKKRAKNLTQNPTPDKPEKGTNFFLNRKIYRELTSEILASIHDDDLERVILDNIDTGFQQGEQYTLEKISKLTNGQQAVFATYWLEAEVNNGGFNQFYFNSTGIFAEMAEIGFRVIGPPKFSELTKKANDTYSEEKIRLEKFDDGSPESFIESYENNPLNDLDQKFYELDKVENIYELRLKYIRNNINEFVIG